MLFSLEWPNNNCYDAFGNTSTGGTASSNPLQYAGRENDGTGLYYYRARYYSPKLGRFISQDPIGLTGGLNMYAYVRGNPVSLVDPLGLCAAHPTSLHCLGVAAGEKGLPIFLDAVGAIPIVGNVGAAIGFGSGAYGAYKAVTAGPEDPPDIIVGGVSASAGIAGTAADIAVGGTKVLPGVGNALSALTGLWDGYKAYEIYMKCIAGN